MGEHLTADGLFQSDKYPTCPPGKVPLSCKDVTAQDLLWEYAQRRRSVDGAFSDDLETALKTAGYVPPMTNHAADAGWVRESAREFMDAFDADDHDGARVDRAIAALRKALASTPVRDVLSPAAVDLTSEEREAIQDASERGVYRYRDHMAHGNLKPYDEMAESDAERWSIRQHVWCVLDAIKRAGFQITRLTTKEPK